MRTLLIASLALLVAFAGCTTTPTHDDHRASLVPVQDRHLEAFNVTAYYSHTLTKGAYGILPGAQHFVDVTLPLTDGPANEAVPPKVSIGLFLPDGLPSGARLPVIADIGPYYTSTSSNVPAGANPLGAGDTPVTVPAHRLGEFLIDNFVPHGYAVAEVSVLGTGDSTHCEDMMGLDEQAGIDAAVTWLGTQDWSNGNVGLIGRSYDGSTPWEAATTGNPHLKTIVPISGLTGLYELEWRNGSAETRAPGELPAIYFTMGVNGSPGDVQNVCPDAALFGSEGAGAYATGSNTAVPTDTYWTDRAFLARAYANYHGSVYLIHGLQDTNVDPHVSVPHLQEMQSHFETKALLGQWYHNYPDRPSEHVQLPAGYGKEAYPSTVRYDWAQDLLEWFDHYLAGTGPQPALDVEVQSNHGDWRIESTYPPATASPLDLALGTDLKFSSGPQNQAILVPASGTLGDTNGQLTYDAPALAQSVRLSGIMHLPLQVTPLASGGQVYAELQDVDALGTAMHVGHAIMDLRFAQGGTTMQPVIPGQAMVAKMEFEPLEATIPAGHHLRLVLSATGQDYLPSAAPAAVMVTGGTLKLTTESPAASQFFTPPAWSGKADATAPQP